MGDALKALHKAAGVTVLTHEHRFERCKLIGTDRVGLVVDKDGTKSFIPWNRIERVELLDSLEEPNVEITGLRRPER